MAHYKSTFKNDPPPVAHRVDMRKATCDGCAYYHDQGQCRRHPPAMASPTLALRMCINEGDVVWPIVHSATRACGDFWPKGLTVEFRGHPVEERDA